MSLSEGHEGELEPLLLQPAAQEEHRNKGHQDDDTDHVDQDRQQEGDEQFQVQCCRCGADADLEGYAADVFDGIDIRVFLCVRLSHDEPYDDGAHNSIEQGRNLSHKRRDRPDGELGQCGEQVFSKEHAQQDNGELKRKTDRRAHV